MDLFNQDEPGVDPGLSNKINSFYSKDVQSKRLTQKERIYLAIEALRLANDRDISKYTGISLNLIPDRRKQLLIEDRIEIAKHSTDPYTKKIVLYYRIKKGK